MAIPDTNICFSTLNSNKTVSCLGEQRCCCYEDSYHAYPTCCSCVTYWWLWALVALFALTTAASILAMYLRRRKRVHGSSSGSEILFGNRSLFNDKYPPKLQDKNDLKSDNKAPKLSEKPYAPLSSEQKFVPSSEQQKRYMPPQDQKYIPPPQTNQKYLAGTQPQKPIPPQQQYLPPPQDYKYPPSLEQRFVPPQPYIGGPSDEKYAPGANKYENRDLPYKRQQEYEKLNLKYDEREVKGLGKRSEGDLAYEEGIEKREE